MARSTTKTAPSKTPGRMAEASAVPMLNTVDGGTVQKNVGSAYESPLPDFSRTGERRTRSATRAAAQVAQPPRAKVTIEIVKEIVSSKEADSFETFHYVSILTLCKLMVFFRMMPNQRSVWKADRSLQGGNHVLFRIPNTRSRHQ